MSLSFTEFNILADMLVKQFALVVGIFIENTLAVTKPTHSKFCDTS